ncbi:MAG: Hint domain-containing protein [Methylobacteriaceae bacterium]
MALPIVFNNQTYDTNFLSQDNDGIQSNIFENDENNPQPYSINGTINAVGDPVVFTSSNGVDQFTAFASNLDNPNQIVFTENADGTGIAFIASNAQLAVGDTETFSETTLGDYAPVCFASGTSIRTACGDVLVEALKVGDMAVTASGMLRPITWIGHRTLDLRRCPDQAAAQPVKIAKDAFAPGRPARDLFVSPGHPICVDVLGEVLIPALSLVNGASVQQVSRESITYWHLELDSHDILLAENLPAESYLDANDRSFFHEGASSPATSDASDGRCRPIMAVGVLPDLVRDRLSERAKLLGWCKSSDMDIHLMVDGVRAEPVRTDGLVRFLVPADAKDVRLMSAWFQPSWGGIKDDRRLGVAVSSIRISDGLFLNREIAPADKALANGFHPVEFKDQWSWRWTTGSAQLPRELWADAAGDFFLSVAFNPAASERWIEPARAQLVEESEEFGNVVRLTA